MKEGRVRFVKSVTLRIYKGEGEGVEEKDYQFKEGVSYPAVSAVESIEGYMDVEFGNKFPEVAGFKADGVDKEYLEYGNGLVPKFVVKEEEPEKEVFEVTPDEVGSPGWLEEL